MELAVAPESRVGREGLGSELPLRDAQFVVSWDFSNVQANAGEVLKYNIIRQLRLQLIGLKTSFLN